MLFRSAHRRFPAVNQEDLLDVWQDTIIMFYEQVRDQKLREMNCSLKTFLFLIGHRRLLKHFRKASRIEYVTEFDVNKCAVENIHPLEPENHADASLELLLTAIDELPEKTRQILSMRYLHGKPLAEVMQIMNYTSLNAVSATISRALKKLKENILERIEGISPHQCHIS